MAEQHKDDHMITITGDQASGGDQGKATLPITEIAPDYVWSHALHVTRY